MNGRLDEADRLRLPVFPSRPAPEIVDDGVYFYVIWPESVEGYREGPYSDRAHAMQRIKEVALNQ